MKKIIVLIIAAVAAVGSYAENTLNVVPFTVSNTTSGSNGYFYISMSNDDCDVTALSFDLYLPTGMRVYTNNSGNLISSSMALVADRTTYYNEDEEDNVSAFASASGHNLRTDSEGIEYYNWQGAGVWPVAGKEGNLFYGRYKLSANMTPGVYPVVVKAAFRNGDDASQNKDVVTTSYVIVGDGGDGSLVLNNAVPSFALEALNSDAVVKSLDLKDVTEINGDFTAVDGRTIVAPTAGVTVSKLTYALEGASETNMKSVMLPYEVTVPAGVAYTTTGAIVGNYVHFDEVTTIPANTPAIVTGDINVELTNVVLQDASTTPVTAGSGYYLAGRRFKAAASNFDAPVYRGVWNLTSGVKGFVLNSADGIKTVELSDVEGSEIFDLSGRKLNKAAKGVNIIGGQKVLRK